MYGRKSTPKPGPLPSAPCNSVISNRTHLLHVILDSAVPRPRVALPSRPIGGAADREFMAPAAAHGETPDLRATRRRIHLRHGADCSAQFDQAHKNMDTRRMFSSSFIVEIRATAATIGDVRVPVSRAGKGTFRSSLAAHP